MGALRIAVRAALAAAMTTSFGCGSAADAATERDSTPDPAAPGTRVHRFHETRYCTLDTTHEWGAVHLQYDGGNMDGFVATNNPGGGRAMGYYTAQDLPYGYWLADTF